MRKHNKFNNKKILINKFEINQIILSNLITADKNYISIKNISSLIQF